MTHVAVIIVAGGSGQRMGSQLPKQFLPLYDGRPILMHTLSNMAEALPEAQLIVVLPHAHLISWQTLCSKHHFSVPHTLCAGGATRFQSVLQGLQHALPADWIAVHDGVRPLIDRQFVRTVLDEAQRWGNAVPCVMSIDSLRRILPDGSSQVEERSQLRRIQTPQIFRADQLMAAYRQPYSDRFTDDASVVEQSGVAIHLCEGSYANLKITTPFDLAIANLRLQELSQQQ